MKKRKIFTVITALFLFSVIALQIQKELKAESENAMVEANVIVMNLNLESNCTVEVRNTLTMEYFILDRIPGKKPPQWKGYIPPGNYVIRICSDYNHGKIDERSFDVRSSTYEFNIQPICPSWGD
jgi:hypothetical protein